jgi:hypothetical protein
VPKASKKMKILSTNLPQSLLSNPSLKNPNKIKVFLEEQNKIYKITIDAHDLTTNGLITVAIDQFNTIHKFNLNVNSELYEVYAARKSGMKD